jgi:hypothetical protein
MIPNCCAKDLAVAISQSPLLTEGLSTKSTRHRLGGPLPHQLAAVKLRVSIGGYDPFVVIVYSTS